MSKRAELEKADLESLILIPAFQRFMSTLLKNSGMFAGNYRADGRHLIFLEGRRSLGLDLLRAIEHVRPEALLVILTEEMKTLKEYPDGRRNYNRNDELDRDAAAIAGSDSRAVFVDYSADGDD